MEDPADTIPLLGGVTFVVDPAKPRTHTLSGFYLKGFNTAKYSGGRPIRLTIYPDRAKEQMTLIRYRQRQAQLWNRLPAKQQQR